VPKGNIALALHASRTVKGAKNGGIITDIVQSCMGHEVSKVIRELVVSGNLKTTLNIHYLFIESSPWAL